MAEQLTKEVPVSSDMQALLERMSRWEREGTLESLERVLKVVSALLEMMTPEMVQQTVRRIAAGLELMDKFAHSEVLPVGPMVEDIESLLRNPPGVQKHELRHLWHELNDPDAQAGLELALGLLKRAGQRTVLKK